MVTQRSLKANWFLYGILFVIVMAKWQPWVGMKGGPLKPELTIKYIAVSTIFFNSGLSLKTDELTTALKQVKVHLFIQSFTFIFIPTFIFMLIKFLYLTTINVNLLHGLTVLSCMPPPVSSAVILTKAVGGNEAAAIFNSAFGSFLGIFTSPMLLLFLMGDSGNVPMGKVMKSLTMTVVAPLLVGQFLRRQESVRGWLATAQPPFGTIGKAILLAIIYSTFCDTFGGGNLNVNFSSLMAIIFIILFMQITLIGITFYVSRRSKMYSPEDTVCMMFCSTHKSLTLGIPMLKIIYAGSSSLSYLSIPLLVYHPTQILLGGILVPYIQKWLHGAKNYSQLPAEEGAAVADA